MREDISPGQKVAQSVHAMADFAVNHEHEFKVWQCGSNYLCCLEAPMYKIECLMTDLDLLKIKYHVFFEPDIGEITGIAIEALPRDTHKRLFKNFKLTLS